MEKKLENKLKKVRSVSRLVFYGSIFLMLSTIFSKYAENIVLFRILVTFGVTLFILYWMMPVFFLFVRKQAFAAAWSRGLSAWEKFKNIDFNNLPLTEKIFMYMNFVLSCVVFIIFFWFLDLISR